MMRILFIIILIAYVLAVVVDLFASPACSQTTVQIGASFATAPRYIQCVDYECRAYTRDEAGKVVDAFVGILEQVSPEELNESEPAAGEDFETEGESASDE